MRDKSQGDLSVFHGREWFILLGIDKYGYSKALVDFREFPIEVIRKISV